MKVESIELVGIIFDPVTTQEDINALDKYFDPAFKFEKEESKIFDHLS